MEVLDHTPDFRDLSFILVTHSYVDGPTEALRDFLLKSGTRRLAYIAHPFHFAPEKKSVMLLYEKGRTIKTIKSPAIPAPQLILYPKDSVFTLLFALIAHRRYSFYVGVDPLNAALGLFLKSMGFVRYVVFYTIDYVPTRFNFRVLNSTYHAVDRFCVEHCDYTWNLSEAMTEARRREGIVGGKQIEVPLGTVPQDKQSNLSRNYEHERAVFIGHLRKGHGLELLIPAFSQVVKKVPHAKLTIIGAGPLEQSLRSAVRDRNLSSSVDFRGYIKNSREVKQIISRCAFGLAPYEPTTESFTWFADPGKPKEYISCGLPVIITSVPRFSKEIQKHEAGMIVQFDENDLAAAMFLLLTNQGLLDRMRLNAAELSKKYSWTNVFTRALAHTIKGISNAQDSLSSREYL
ncbi:MAG: glycosyltransferase [Nitrososphaerota archaeon]|nr:glycosyltransferase [Nitrososphaerota archaeon]